ncbi:MAG: hypothetical protein V2A69_09630 [Pseudomonadota bacterium]
MEGKRLTRGQAIVLHCRECFGYDGHRGGSVGTPYVKAGMIVKECTDTLCPLFPFRNGMEERERDCQRQTEKSLQSEHAIEI